MTHNRHRVRVVATSSLALMLLAAVAQTRGEIPALTERQRVVHALDRLAYGPRPGDVERVERMGLDKWIDQQLHPERIDDSVVDAKLKTLFPTLELPAYKLVKPFYEEVRDFIYMQQANADPKAAEDMKLRTGLDVKKAYKKPADAPAGKPGFGAVMKSVAKNVTLRALAELQTAKLTRAIESERQLNEVLVDFWTNHFNVDVKKDTVRVFKIVEDREAIRPHVLGKFRKLLGASASSPAMLVYLDNVQNSAPHDVSPFEQRVRSYAVQTMIGIDVPELHPKKQTIREGGLNENYGRELLELHTLGVDGGYTQKDVVDVARCFTGWGLSPLTGGFAFEARKHDNGEKTVLGHKIPAGGGVKDGMMVLDILAKHPSTAKFISTKLCRRLVADDPPAALVDRVAKVFLDTDGDLREVVRSIVTSDEFFSPAAYRSKIKSPLEFAVSAVRATGGKLEPHTVGFLTPQIRYVAEGAGTVGYGGERLSASHPKTLNWHVYDMGQPLFACQPPTGYTENSRKWVSSGALISRINFARELAKGDVMDVTRPEKMPVAEELLQVELSASTRAVLEKHTAKTGDDGGGELTALVLSSPEFQRR
jgi:uncharacterized protein (DUF1800 family)